MIIVLLMGISYLLGSIPSGVWIGKHFYQKDIRQYGSGNMGTTNTFRVLGKKAGTIVLCMDILKGTIPTVIALYTLPNISPFLFGFFAILGHTFPLFANFKGGKAVATTTGVVFAIYPLFMLLGVFIFLTSLYIYRMVSLSSIVTAVILTVIAFFLNDVIFTVFAILVSSFIVYRHRSNIRRIIDGTESKVPFGLGYKK